ncbi:hypothetical protein GCM10009809_31400 [Isoptericola hypogeus]|uniref:Aromatic acid exporter family member 1 n=1 Tax=Isoptericola hypogeus TaxID=300179 RepID=A0ABN2JP35_9MICO
MAGKGALAACLAWLVGVLAPAPFSEYPYYAPLGAVVATTSTVARSVRESLQAIGALLVGAGIGLVAQVLPLPSPFGVAIAVGAALLCAGWRVLGEMGGWAPTSAIFVLILGNGDELVYVGAYAGLVVVGAAIGVCVNLLLPPLPVTPSELALDRLRDGLVEQVEALSAWLEDTGPLEPDEWERRRRALDPTIEQARVALAQMREAARANRRARHDGDRAARQDRRARELGTAAEVVDEVVRLLVTWEGEGRDDVALGPRLRPTFAVALQAFAGALRPAETDAEERASATRFAEAVDELRDVVASTRDGASDVHLVAGALVVVLRRAVDALAA